MSAKPSAGRRHVTVAGKPCSPAKVRDLIALLIRIRVTLHNLNSVIGSVYGWLDPALDPIPSRQKRLATARNTLLDAIRIVSEAQADIRNTLPQDQPQPGEKEPVENEEPATQQSVKAAAASERLRVLVVDDSEGFAETLQYFFTLRDCAVELARTVEEAKKVIAEGAVDIVVVDRYLANEDGFTLAIHARRLHPWMFVVLTSGDNVDYGSQLDKWQANYFFPKPSSLEALQSLLDAAQQHLQAQASR